MIIRNLKRIQINGHTKVSVDVLTDNGEVTELWFSIPDEYSRYLSDGHYDGFVVGLLYPAMFKGENILVEGRMSKKLLFNLNSYVIPLLEAFSPSSRRVRIESEETSDECFRGKGVGTGFSAGVDSFSTIYERLELEEDLSYKINSFLFLNVGSHGEGKNADQLDFARRKFINRYEYLKCFPDELGLDFIPIDSNLHSFHPWGHLKTDTLTSAAGILMLQRLYFRYYYASTGFTYSDQFKFGNKFKEVSVADCCDPMIVSLLSTESLDLVLDGMSLSRAEKLTRISHYEPIYRYLNVCVSFEAGHKNCSVCHKCCRTIMALKSMGKVHDFEHLFDFKKYEKSAERLYASKQVLKVRTDPFARENVELAKRGGLRLPSYIEALFRCGIMVCMRKLRCVARRCV